MGESSPTTISPATGGRDQLQRGLASHDAFTESHRQVLKGHLDRVTSLSFSSDDQTLASGSWDSTVRLWQTASRQDVGVLNAHRGKIEAVAFSPDGNVLATAGQRDADHGEVLLWRASQ